METPRDNTITTRIVRIAVTLYASLRIFKTNQMGYNTMVLPVLIQRTKDRHLTLRHVMPMEWLDIKPVQLCDNASRQ